MTLVTLQAALDRVGVEHDTDDAARVLLLLRAISAETEQKAGRTWSATDSYVNEVIDSKGVSSVILSSVPVSDLLSVNTVYGDGEDGVIDYPSRVVWDGVTSYATGLAAPVAIGDTNVKVDDVADIEVGHHILISDDEVRYVTAVGTAGAGGTGVDFMPAARFANSAGSIYHVAGADAWVLDDPRRGKVYVREGRRLLRFIYRVAAETVPYDLQEAVLAWLGSSWAGRALNPALSSYTTGDDSESYSVSSAELAGTAPPDAARTLSRYWRRVRNGVV